jgi:hypothetical protein
MKKLPILCPSCEQSLAVSQLSCTGCETVITGNYALPGLLKLPAEDQEFIFQFILTGGSLKKMASKLEKSYPTVRNKLDDIIEQIEKLNS